MTQGIDMDHSGWDNPLGFKPRERDQAPPPVAACEAAGPDGWVCDLPPHHRGDNHKADGGPSWPVGGHPAPVRFDDAENVTMPPSEADRDVLAKVRRVAQEASISDRAIIWAAALAEIEKLTDGY
jgi:hypothetical protein